MHGALVRQRFGGARSSPRARLAAWCTAVGLADTVITIIVCAVNAVTTQQAIAMALFAGLTTAGGLIGKIIPDAWTAWRRGFRQGCETALKCKPGGLDSSIVPRTRRKPGRRSG